VLKLHLGCGDVYFDGWVNIDRESEKADVKLDLRSTLPYDNDSVDFIYSEHVIEHLTVQEGIRVLSECHRVLKSGGVVRIATPDLNYVIFRYLFFWKRQDWIKTYGYDWIRTRAEMLNIGMREWGHQYLYNGEELDRRLREVGFLKISRAKLNRSKFNELQQRETRRDSKLIMEAIK
jgi:predicted SAM-dependent methyltransferase